MILSDLYTDLALDQLSNLALAEGGVIREADRPKIIRHINDGLERLHTRFLLKEADFFLELRGHITRYNLRAEHAQSNAEGPIGNLHYIADLNSPFQDNVIRVLEVWDGRGIPLPINDLNTMYGVFTPQAKVLQVSFPKSGEILACHYQAGPRVLADDDDDVEVDLPDFLVPALKAWVAHKVFDNMNTQEMILKGDKQLRTFESICVEAVELELVTTGPTTSGHRFEKNGWV